MRIQLDTNEKTIKIEESVNLGELVKTLEGLLPNKLWKEFKLEITVIYNWINPIPWSPEPWRPGIPVIPWVTYDINASGAEVKLYEVKFISGTFNILTQ